MQVKSKNYVMCSCTCCDVVVYLNFCFLCVSSVAVVPGLDDRDNKNAAEEKKRAYQFELQRQVCPIHLYIYLQGCSIFIVHLQSYIAIVTRNYLLFCRLWVHGSGVWQMEADKRKKQREKEEKEA